MIATAALLQAKETTGRRPGTQLPLCSIDKNSFTPIYAQIEAQLLEMIRSGRLQAGDLLPSEEQLSRIFGISRMTARQALLALKNKGLASRQKGKGTFVTQPKMEKDIAHLSGFSAEMRTLGMKPSSRVLRSETIPASEEVATRLAIRPEEPIFRLCRLRLADNVPLAIEEICLSAARFPGIHKIDFSRHSLYQTLHERYEVRFGVADETLEARAAGKHEAELLEVAPRSSLLVISRVLWSVDGEPIEAANSSYRGDRYRAVLRIPASTVE
jgi:GntR family transcriptional regulator